MNGMTRNLCKTYISEILFKEGLSINQSVPNSKGSVGFDSVVPPNFSVSSMTFAKGRRRMLSCRHRNTRREASSRARLFVSNEECGFLDVLKKPESDHHKKEISPTSFSHCQFHALVRYTTFKQWHMSGRHGLYERAIDSLKLIAFSVDGM